MDQVVAARLPLGVGRDLADHRPALAVVPDPQETRETP
jgi:hypothetical protein